MESSAKNRHNVDEVFMEVVRAIRYLEQRSTVMRLTMQCIVINLPYRLSSGSFRRQKVHRSLLITRGSRRVVAVPAPSSDCPSALLPRRLKPSRSRLVPYMSTRSVCVCVWHCMHQCFIGFYSMYELVFKKKLDYKIRVNRESVGKREFLFHPRVPCKIMLLILDSSTVFVYFRPQYEVTD